MMRTSARCRMISRIWLSMSPSRAGGRNRARYFRRPSRDRAGGPRRCLQHRAGEIEHDARYSLGRLCGRVARDREQRHRTHAGRSLEEPADRGDLHAEPSAGERKRHHAPERVAKHDHVSSRRHCPGDRGAEMTEGVALQRIGAPVPWQVRVSPSVRAIACSTARAGRSLPRRSRPLPHQTRRGRVSRPRPRRHARGERQMNVWSSGSHFVHFTVWHSGCVANPHEADGASAFVVEVCHDSAIPQSRTARSTARRRPRPRPARGRLSR